MFPGNYKYATVNNVSMATKRETDKQGKAISWVQVVVKPGKHVKIGVKQ
jgi:hypothetical protein